jgi:DNA adenine methylase
LLGDFDKHLPKNFGKYHEPFLGGGALFFHLASKGRLRDPKSYLGRAVLSDVNQELVNAYRVVRDHPNLLIIHLANLAEHASSRTIYDKLVHKLNMRAGSPVERAARFIFINKTCFNGLWRVNQNGDMNTPWGQYASPAIMDVKNIEACSLALQGVEILHQGFESSLSSSLTTSGDLFYFDPPYVPASLTSSFTGYASEGFTHQDQVKLRDTALQLSSMGATVFLSNSDTPIVRDLYAKDFTIIPLDVYRGISADSSRRGTVGELLLTTCGGG